MNNDDTDFVVTTTIVIAINGVNFSRGNLSKNINVL